jgi:hypothetical protein
VEGNWQEMIVDLLVLDQVMQNWLTTSFGFFGELVIPISTVFSKEVWWWKNKHLNLVHFKMFSSNYHIFTFLCALPFGIDVELGLKLKHWIDASSFIGS